MQQSYLQLTFQYISNMLISWHFDQHFETPGEDPGLPHRAALQTRRVRFRFATGGVMSQKDFEMGYQKLTFFGVAKHFYIETSTSPWPFEDYLPARVQGLCCVPI